MQKSKFRVFGFKSETAVLTFSFCFLASPFLSISLPPFFFFCWAFTRLHFGWVKFLGELYDLRIR